MSSNYVCPKCENHFATRQSVWKDKERCKARRDGAGFSFTPASNGVVSVRKLDTVHKHVDDGESTCSDESSTAEEDSTIADIVEDDPEPDEEDDYVWSLISFGEKLDDKDVIKHW